MPAVVDFKCKERGCEIRVPRADQRCPADRQAWLASRYHPPEPPGAVFTCMVPDCGTRVLHLEMMCDRHWSLVPRNQQYKIRAFAQRYRVALGEALAKVIADELRGQVAAADGAEPSSHA